MLWQDKYTCDKLICDRDQLIEKLKQEKDENKIEKLKKSQKINDDHIKFWAELLTKQYIFQSVENISIDRINAFILDPSKHTDIDKFIEELTPESSEKDRTKIIENILKNVTQIMDKEKNKEIYREFFNEKPIIFYKSELEKIQEIGKKYSYAKNGRRISNELMQKYMFVWLAWQKSYNNRYIENLEWCIDKEEELRKYVENGCDSGQRTNRFKKLIEDGYITYQVQPVLNIRKEFPKLVYKINFLVNEGEEAFAIDNFRYIWEHYLIHCNSKKYGFCEKCGIFIEKKHGDKRFCEACQKAN